MRPPTAILGYGVATALATVFRAPTAIFRAPAAIFSASGDLVRRSRVHWRPRVSSDEREEHRLACAPQFRPVMPDLTAPPRKLKKIASRRPLSAPRPQPFAYKLGQRRFENTDCAMLCSNELGFKFKSLSKYILTLREAERD